MAFLSTHPFALIPFFEESGLAPSDVDHQAYLRSLLVEFRPDDTFLEDEEDLVFFASDERWDAPPPREVFLSWFYRPLVGECDVTY